MRLEHIPILPTLRARWTQIVLWWLVLVVTVAAVSLLLPPRYEATASVVVEMSGTDPIMGQTVFKPAGAVSTYIATQTDILRSEEVARGALRSLRLHELPEWRDRWVRATGGEGDLQTWISGRLLRKLAVQPGRDSNVLNLSFTWGDPEFAADVANAFVNSYMDATLSMRVKPAQQFNSFFEERAKTLREELERARARLTAYEKQHGLFAGAVDVEDTRLTQLTMQLVGVEDQLADAVNRRRQAAAVPREVREIRGDPQVSALSADLAVDQARLTKLKSEFGEQHPSVIEARRSIEATRERLESATAHAAQTFAVPLRANEARLAELKRSLERQRDLVLQRKAQRDAATVLVRDVENAQRAYDGVLQRASQTALESANTTQPNVAVLKSATAPSVPISLLWLNLGVAFLVAPLIGVARALIAEMRDRRLRTFEDVGRWLQQPLLLALPDGLARRRLGARHSTEVRQRLVPVHGPKLLTPRGGGA